MRLRARIFKHCIAACAAFALGCSSSQPAEVVRSYLDRPTAVGFACAEYDATSAATNMVAQGVCAKISTLLPAQRSGIALVGFVLDAVRGEVAAFHHDDSLGSFLVDLEPNQPGYSFVPVGTGAEDLIVTPDSQRVVVTSRSQCGLVSFSAASAAKIAAVGATAGVTVTPITQQGQPVRSPPKALLALPAQLCQSLTGSAATPSQHCAVVTLPECAAVVAVDTDGGEVLRAWAYESGNLVAKSSLSCVNSCGGTGASPSDVSALATTFSADSDGGGRLFVGRADSPTLSMIGIAANGSVDAARSRQLTLENAGGISSIAVSPAVSAGGSALRFAYVVARDNSVRVVKLGDGASTDSTLVECDAQIDPRDVAANSPENRACAPVGSGLTRRAGATSPGIRLPGSDLPRGVGFAEVDSLLPAEFAQAINASRPIWSPSRFNGTFAYVTGVRGRVYAVNIVDRDAISLHPDDVIATRAHQLRSAVTAQYDAAAIAVTRSAGVPRATTVSRSYLPDSLRGGRIELRAADPGPTLRTVLTADGNAIAHPFQRLPGATTPTIESITAERLSTFPDLQSLSNGDRWSFVWQGSLTADLVRFGGQVTPGSAGQGTFTEESRPFCALGVESGDLLTLRGCDLPTDCPIGTTCMQNPAAPLGVTGLCLPGDETEREQLAAQCADALVTSRTYEVLSVQANQLLFAPAPELPPNSDLCASDGACPSYQDLKTGILRNYTCDTSPIPTAPNRCVATCTASGGCGAGYTCDSSRGRCVGGPAPRAQCFGPLQRYEVSVGNGLYVSRTGQVAAHRWIESQSGDGSCVVNPNSSPFEQNRIRRHPPECAVDNTVPCLFEDGGQRYVRFENAAFSLDFANIAGPIPRDFVMSMDIGGGFAAAAVDLDATFPASIVNGPDGMLYVVQSGDGPSGSRGALQRIQPINFARDTSFLIR